MYIVSLAAQTTLNINLWNLASSREVTSTLMTKRGIELGTFCSREQCLNHSAKWITSLTKGTQDKTNNNDAIPLFFINVHK